MIPVRLSTVGPPGASKAREQPAGRQTKSKKEQGFFSGARKNNTTDTERKPLKWKRLRVANTKEEERKVDYLTVLKKEGECEASTKDVQ